MGDITEKITGITSAISKVKNWIDYFSRFFYVKLKKTGNF